jgi:uncharacterized protein YeaO (DUF488 family)
MIVTAQQVLVDGQAALELGDRGSERLDRAGRRWQRERGQPMTSKHDVRVRRAYDERAAEDGTRVLVDRIWPRGLSKEKAGFDEWCKAVAPSTALRQWYGHDPERFAEFSRRYQAELEEPERAGALEHLRDLAGRGTLTLITATKHADISEAVVLARLLRA